jgi:hypothetical protein
MDKTLARGLFGFGEGVVFIADVMLRIPRRGGIGDFTEKVSKLVLGEVNRFEDSAWALTVKSEALEFVDTLESIIEAQTDETRTALAEEGLGAMRRRRTSRALKEAKREIIAQGYATPENVNQVAYDMPVTQFKALTAKWPKLSRVDFKLHPDA